jgi:hypothetical protein
VAGDHAARPHQSYHLIDYPSRLGYVHQNEARMNDIEGSSWQRGCLRICLQQLHIPQPARGDKLPREFDARFAPLNTHDRSGRSHSV